MDDDLYEVVSEGPNFQIPECDQSIDADKLFAMDNCGSYIGKAYNNLKETLKYREKEDKKKKEKKDILMREGNKAYRERDYKKALKCYNKAIDNVVNSCVLYTNRAMTYLKLGKPRPALMDTHSALYWNPENLKALIYKAQALYLLGDVMESDFVVATACQIHPGKAETIKLYLKIEQIAGAVSRLFKIESTNEYSLDFQHYIVNDEECKVSGSLHKNTENMEASLELLSFSKWYTVTNLKKHYNR